MRGILLDLEKCQIYECGLILKYCKETDKLWVLGLDRFSI